MTTRRQFIHGAAGLGTGLLTGGMPVSWAALPGEARFLLVILRGGLDGLAAFPPYGDPDFAAARGGLALPAPGRPGGAIRLDGRHGMHPSLAPLSEFYEREEMLVLPAVAGPQRTRSHFDAQEVLENGLSHANKGMEGWLNRALGHLQSGPDRLGLAIGYDVPLVLWGGVPVASWAPARLPPSDATLLDKVERLYARDALFAKALKEGRTAKKMAGKVMDGSMKKGRGNLRSPGRFAALAAAAGRFLAEPAGTRIAVLEMGGWDTHANQGVSEGRLARNLAPLADGLVQCRSQLGPAWNHTVIAVVTEFGRTVRMNGTRGTDHGTAGAAFLLGGAVAGGRVAGGWPGLSPEKLYKGRDLAPVIDMRAIFAGILHEHLGVSCGKLRQSVFPAADSPVNPSEGFIRT